MNTPLLQVLTFENRKPGKLPLMMEFPVNAQLVPILVSSTRSTIWLDRLHKNKVRAAMRDVPDDGLFFREVLDAVEEKSLKEGWGSVLPMTEEGLREAMDHLRYYDIKDMEILAHPNFDWGEHLGLVHPISLYDAPVREADWMPLNKLAVVPMNREYLGFVIRDGGSLTSVTHNAARGIGLVVAEDWYDDDDGVADGGSAEREASE